MPNDLHTAGPPSYADLSADDQRSVLPLIHERLRELEAPTPGRWWVPDHEIRDITAAYLATRDRDRLAKSTGRAPSPSASAPRRINGASGRPAARRTASRSAGGGSDGDDGPAEPEPPPRRLTLAPRRGIYTFAVLPPEVWR